MTNSARGRVKLAEGKTKAIYSWPDDALLAEMEHKDAITAGDGARRHTLADKSVWSCRTMDRCFYLLQQAGIPTHYVRRLDDRHTLVRLCAMIPVEIVARRLATGSYLKRHPEIPEGTAFDPPLVEFFLKDDARHDPLVTAADLVDGGVAAAGEVALMEDLARRVFAVLEPAWARLNVTLVDMKIECGRDADGRLLVADVIDNDSWRLWPGGRRAEMLDKQVYRNFAEVTEEGLARVAANYARVAALIDRFVRG
ncbi:MAG: phosphoribosylaminoimidazolesuccinocarboxamide synthase [Chloroflexota bacterium]